MSTRSTITLKTKENKYQSIYCHFDGYLHRNGVILNNHYTTYDKIKDLVDLGDIRGLGEDIGPSDFEDGTRGYDRTEAYHRDCGESLRYTITDSYEEIERQDYNYLFEDGTWYVGYWDDELQPLAPLVAGHLLKKSS